MFIFPLQYCYGNGKFMPLCVFKIVSYLKWTFWPVYQFPFSFLFQVDFTIKNRTGQSAYHFLRGMFGDEAVGNIELPQPYSPNFVLRVSSNSVGHFMSIFYLVSEFEYIGLQYYVLGLCLSLFFYHWCNLGVRKWRCEGIKILYWSLVYYRIW